MTKLKSLKDIKEFMWLTGRSCYYPEELEDAAEQWIEHANKQRKIHEGRRECNECLVAYNKEWRSKNREKSNAYGRARNKKRRDKIITAYGGKCVCCGESTPEFLAIDHVHNTGADERRQYGGGGIYNQVIKDGFPDKYQLLCHNCNLAKGFYGECPHVRRV